MHRHLSPFIIATVRDHQGKVALTPNENAVTPKHFFEEIRQQNSWHNHLLMWGVALLEGRFLHHIL